MERSYFLKTVFVLLIIANKFGCLHSGRAPISDQEMLVRYVFEDKQYDPLTRPVVNKNESVRVQVGLALIQIVQLEEKYQRLKSNVWLRMSWNDHRLTWNPSEFAGIESIRYAAEKLWKPDIVILNNVDGKFKSIWDPNAVLHSDGHVLWIPPAIFKTSCEIDVRYFPFDQQTCRVELGSWTYTKDQVELEFYSNQTNIDLSDYVTSGVWDFVAGPGDFMADSATTIQTPNVSSRLRHGTASNRRGISRLVFKIVLRRKPLFYITNIIIPCVLIALLGISVFCLPTDAGEKITLSISILVTLVVYMILVSKMLPAGPKSIPLLSCFLLFTFAMTFLSLCITAAVINLNHRNPKRHPRLPQWIQGICTQRLPPFFCLQSLARLPERPTVGTDTPEESNENESTSDEENEEITCHCWEKEPLVIVNHQACEKCRVKNTLLSDMNEKLNIIMKCVNRIRKHVKSKQREEQAQEDWKHVTLVIDRLQLIIFICVMACGLSIILFSAFYIFSDIDQSAIIRKFSYNNRG